MDNAWIGLKESLNAGFIHVVQVESPIVQPVTEPGDRIHLHRHRGRQETLLFNMFQVRIEMRSQRPHAKSLEKIGINEFLHLPRMAIPGHRTMPSRLLSSALLERRRSRYSAYSGMRHSDA